MLERRRNNAYCGFCRLTRRGRLITSRQGTGFDKAGSATTSRDYSRGVLFGVETVMAVSGPLRHRGSTWSVAWSVPNGEGPASESKIFG